MKNLSKLLLAFTFIIISVNKGSAQESLYKRLGGYDAIAAVTDDFITRLATDKSLSKFFVGHSDDSKKKIRQHIVDMVCMATGGPCVYQGRDMKVSHKGLGITEADWTTAVNHFLATLNKFNVPKKSRMNWWQLLLPQKKILWKNNFADINRE